MAFDYWGDGQPLLLPDKSTGGLEYWGDGSPLPVIYDSVQSALIVSPSSIASAEAFGTASVNQAIAPGGIASSQAFGTARVGYVVVPSGIPSAEALGIAEIIPGAITLSPAGIISEEAFGTHQIEPGAVAIQPSGIVSDEAVSAGAVVSRLFQQIFVDAIESEENFPFSNLSVTAYENPDDGTEETIIGGRNWRVIVPGANIAASGNRIQITIRNGKKTSVLGGCSIGQRNVSTDDFVATPTRVTFNNGDHGVTLAKNETVVSDWIPYNLDNLKNYLIHLYFSGTHYMTKWTASGTYEDARLDPVNETLIKVVDYTLISSNAYSIKKISTQVAISFIYPGGTATGEVVPSPSISSISHILPTGIISGGDFGSPALTLFVKPTAITSREAVGSPLVEAAGPGLISLFLSIGIEGEEAFGTPALIYDQVLEPSGIASQGALGAVTVIPLAMVVQPDGIATGEALGGPALSYEVYLYPEEIVSAGGFGLLSVVSMVASDGIATEEIFGDPKVIPGQVEIYPSGVTPGAMGDATVFPGTVYPLPDGIASEEVFGAAKLILSVLPDNIESDEAFGTAVLTLFVKPVGIEPGEVGEPVMGGNVKIIGIVSAEAVEVPQLNLILGPEAILSGGVCGIPEVVPGPVWVYPPSIEGVEAGGRPRVVPPKELSNLIILEKRDIEPLVLIEGQDTFDLYYEPLRMVSNE